MNTQPAAQPSASMTQTKLMASLEPPVSPRRLALELPTRLADAWSGRFPQDAEPAVVTVGWMGDLALVVVILKRGAERQALVLDPTEPIVGSLVERCNREGRLLLRFGRDGLPTSEGVKVLVRGMAREVVAHMQGRPVGDAFCRAVADRTGVQRLLNRLARSHHVRWAKGAVAAVPAAAP